MVHDVGTAQALEETLPTATCAESSVATSASRRVLVLRHGARPDDGVDPSLDALGQWQVEQVVAYFLQEMQFAPGVAPVTAIFSSPLKRAVQTAMPLAEALDLSVRLEWGFIDLLAHRWLYHSSPLPALEKRKLKSMQGYARVDPLYKSAVLPEYPDLEGRMQQGVEEQRRRALRRHRAAVEASLASSGGGSILVVGHGATHDFVAEALCPSQHQKKHMTGGYCVGNCSITEIVEDDSQSDGWRLAAFGHALWESAPLSKNNRLRARNITRSCFAKPSVKRQRSVARPQQGGCPGAILVTGAAATALALVIWLRSKGQSK